MAVYNGPPRAGSRGGRDQFDWENVRNDKDRSYYLGHSVKALTGRWQQGKDVYWYTRDKRKEDDDINDELRAVKEEEDRLMAEALGLKPKSTAGKAPLDQAEMQRLLQRPDSDDEGKLDTAVRGVGYSGHALGGVAGSDRLEGYDDLSAMRGEQQTQVAAGPSGSGASLGPVQALAKKRVRENDARDSKVHAVRRHDKSSKKHRKEKRHKEDREKKGERHRSHKARRAAP